MLMDSGPRKRAVGSSPWAGLSRLFPQAQPKSLCGLRLGQIWYR
jgi:hypothetical protein